MWYYFFSVARDSAGNTENFTWTADDFTYVSLPGGNPAFTFQLVSPRCSDTADGVIAVNTLGGTPPYYYSWDGTQGNDTLFNALGGTHHLIVTDALADVVLDSLFVLAAPAPLTYSMNAGSIACFGGTTSATVMAFGGTGAYVFDWSGADPQNLSAGTHPFMVADENGCTVNGQVNLTQPDALASTQTVSNAATTTSCDGSVLLNVTGGVAPYTVSWNNGSFVGNPYNNLCAGQYDAVITDANGCTYTTQVIDVNTAVIDLSAETVQVSISPNPGTGQFMVNLNARTANEISWRVYDMKGSLVKQQQGLAAVVGKNAFEIDLRGMASGQYSLHLEGKDLSIRRNLMLVDE
jgi:hypothetical protein